MSRRCAGFTLVEMMVTLAIMAFLLLASLPFTRSWVVNQRQLQVRDVVFEGVAQARALALRNPEAVGPDDAVDRLMHRFDAGGNHWLELRKMLPAGASTLVWMGNLPDLGSGSDRISLQGLEQGKCLAFDKKGQLLPAAGSCVASRSIKVMVNNDMRGLADVKLP